MSQKTFATDQQFYTAVLDGVDKIAARQRTYSAELMAVVEPLAALHKRRQAFEEFGQAVSGLSRGSFGAAPVSLRSACESVLESDPKKRAWLRAAVLVLCRSNRALWGEAELEFEREFKARQTRAITTGDSSLGQATTGAIPLSADVYSLLLRYAAFRTLGVVPLATGFTKLANVTGKPSAIWLTSANQGTAIPADGSLSGASITPEVATLGTLVEVSGELLADSKTTFEGAVLAAIVEGMSYRLDWSAFRADGTDDSDDGGMTGIFSDATIPAADAAAGHTSIANLDRFDLVRAIAAVAPSALQRECRWWISPALLPKLISLRDGNEILLTRPTAAGDDWMLMGFPVTWTAVAPATDAASEKIAAFGRTDAYTVALRQDFEVMSSGSAKFDQNIWQFRGIARARCITRDATSLATLRLAAA